MLQWKFIISSIEEMLQPNGNFKYRSIKYSISASSLKKNKTENEYQRENEPSRHSAYKENLKGVQRPQTSYLFKSSHLQQRWNNTASSSVSYKLRIVANSSHAKRQSVGKSIQAEGQQQVILFKPSYTTPYEDYYSNLQETLQNLPSLLYAEQKQTKQIKISMQIIQEKAQNQLQQTEQYFHSEINKLRILMSMTFKNHSRQIINTRQSINSLHEQFMKLQGKCSQISKQIMRLDDNFNS